MGKIIRLISPIIEEEKENVKALKMLIDTLKLSEETKKDCVKKIKKEQQKK